MAIAVRETHWRIGRAESAGFSNRFVLLLVVMESLILAFIAVDWECCWQNCSACMAIPRMESCRIFIAAAGDRERSGHGAACRSGRRNFPAMSAIRLRVVDAIRESNRAIPVIYNLRSVRAAGLRHHGDSRNAGTVSVFVAMMSLARGFKMALVSSGSIQNARFARAAHVGNRGAVSLDQVKVITGAPGIARSELVL